MSELLSIEGLRAGYGEAVVLPDMSLRLAESQVLALLGRNGTGKTTLILNLARSLLTGQNFLGSFGIRAIDGDIAILNYEVSGDQLARPVPIQIALARPQWLAATLPRRGASRR